MVDAGAAGVAFSADPVSGRRGVAVVSAVRGLGNKLVDGAADADTFRIDRAGRIVEQTVAVPASGPAIAPAQAVEVAVLAHRSARHFGRAQDIEWAFEGGKLFLLQSRAITSLGAVADPAGRRLIWDNSNIAESYSGVTTPLTFTFARRAYEEVYRQFCRLMGVRASVIAENADVFPQMLGIVRGRVYYNLISWYRVLAMLPGFTMNRRFMEQMMGVKEGVPDELLGNGAPAGRGARLRDSLAFARSVAGLICQHRTLPRQIDAFYRRLNAALAPPVPALEDQRLDELVAHYRDLERQLLTRWDAPLVNDFFAMIFFGLLRALAAKWCGADAALQNDLVAGAGDIVSAEPARRVRAMAAAIRGEAGLIETLCSAPADAALAAVAQHGELNGLFCDYLDVFGDRCLQELKLESLTLHDDPLPLLRSIGHFARRLANETEAAPVRDEAAVRRAAEAAVRTKLGPHPLRRALFGWVLRHARSRVSNRENLRFERTRLFGRVRRIFLECGKRMTETGALDEPRDVFFLELGEILGFVEGTATLDRLGDLANLRKSAFARYAAETDRAPAPRFETHGAVNAGNRFRPERTEAMPGGGGEERRGLGCCAGVVRGVARVVVDPRGAELRAGEILVASRTDPGWILLFPAAAGVVVEYGSLLSHSAIVAREMGIPAVVSVPELTAWLVTGDEIELDGSTGAVRRLRKAGT
jgi:pyruvate,water dikinase